MDNTYNNIKSQGFPTNIKIQASGRELAAHQHQSGLNNSAGGSKESNGISSECVISQIANECSQDTSEGQTGNRRFEHSTPKAGECKW